MSTQEDKILEELKKIKTLMEPSQSPPEGLWDEFISFLTKYKVMGLAVAFIMGVYLGALVQALVQDLVMPLIGLLVPNLENLATLTLEIHQQEFLIGDFLAALITFIIIAFVIFLLVKITKKWGVE